MHRAKLFALSTFASWLAAIALAGEVAPPAFRNQKQEFK
jgi:hypothetical protein